MSYSDPERFVAELRAAGSVNWSRQGRPGLIGRRKHHAQRAIVKDQRADDGRWHVSIEVVWGQAWAGRTGTYRDHPETEIPLTALRRPDRPQG